MGGGGDGTDGVARFDRIAGRARQAADIFGARHGTRCPAAGDGGGPSREAAHHVAGAGHGTGRVGLRHCAQSKTDKPTDIVGALDGAGRRRGGDRRRAGEAGQPADAFAAGGDVAAGARPGDRSGFHIAEQPAHIRTGGVHIDVAMDVGDRAAGDAPRQGAHGAQAADAAAGQGQVLHGGTGRTSPDLREQAHARVIRRIDGQVRNGMALPVQAAGEGVAIISDGLEALPAPDAGRGQRAVGGGKVDVGAQHIGAGQVGVHQLKLVAIHDGGHPVHHRRGFPAADGAHVAGLVPGGGEVPVIAGVVARLRAGQPRGAAGRCAIQGAGLRGAVRVPIGLGEGHSAAADKTALRRCGARRGHHAGGIDARQGGGVAVCHHTAGNGGARIGRRDRARGIAVGDGAGRRRPDQAPSPGRARCGCGRNDGARGIDIGEGGAQRGAHQPTCICGARNRVEGHRPGGIGIGDRAPDHRAHQAAGLGPRARDGAGGIGVGDDAGAGGLPHQTADGRIARGGACGIDVDQRAAGILPDQAADDVAGGISHIAGGVRRRNRARIIPDQPTGFPPQHPAGRARVGDGAGIEADNAACIVAAGDRNARGDRGDGALVVADKPARIESAAGHTAAVQDQIVEDRTRVRIAEQASVIATVPLDGEGGNGVALAVQAAGEAGGIVPEPLEADVAPDAGGGGRAVGGGQVDVGAQHIGAGEVQLHQLQLVGTDDGGDAVHHRSGFPAADGAHVAGLVPAVGEIPAHIAGGLARLGAGEAGGAGGGGAIQGTGLHGAVRVPIGVGEGRGAAADKTARLRRSARRGDGARGIDAGQGAADAGSHQTASIGCVIIVRVHRAGGIAVRHGAGVHLANQSAGRGGTR